MAVPATATFRAPALVSALPRASTSANRRATATSLTTVMPSSARATGPWASSSLIIAIVTAGDDAAASVPSTSATTSASPSGWCRVSGDHGLTQRTTRLTAGGGDTIAPLAGRAGRPPPPAPGPGGPARRFFNNPERIPFFARQGAGPRGADGEPHEQVARETRQPHAPRDLPADVRDEQKEAERQGRACFERSIRGHAMKKGHHQAQREQTRHPAHGPQSISRHALLTMRWSADIFR